MTIESVPGCAQKISKRAAPPGRSETGMVILPRRARITRPAPASLVARTSTAREVEAPPMYVESTTSPRTCRSGTGLDTRMYVLRPRTNPDVRSSPVPPTAPNSSGVELNSLGPHWRARRISSASAALRPGFIESKPGVVSTPSSAADRNRSTINPAVQPSARPAWYWPKNRPTGEPDESSSKPSVSIAITPPASAPRPGC